VISALQDFNTEVTEILRALRVEVLIATEYAEPMCGDDRSSVLKGKDS
jgi:hypothetical protein